MANVDSAELASNDPAQGAALVGMAGGGTLQAAVAPVATRSALAARGNRTMMVYLLEGGRQ